MKNGIYPRKIVFFLFFIPLALIIISFAFKLLLYIGLISNVVLILILFIDIFISPNIKKKLNITVKFDQYLRLNKYADFILKITNDNSLPVKFYFLLDLDIAFNKNYSKQIIKVNPKSKSDIILKIFPSRRGFFKSDLYFIKAHSLFNFFYIYQKYTHELAINVVPTTYSKGDSFRFLQKTIKKYEGAQKNKVLGDGKDFEMLRDYVRGDEFGKIDWKATAKVRKPFTRVYRLENSFELAVMIDCGRLMSTEIQGLSLLDYAVNASLVLSYAAVKSGDQTSFTAFSKSIIKYIPPSKNIKSIKKLNYVLTDLQYEFVESNYNTAFSFIRSKLTKRSFIVIFTDIIDDSSIKIYRRYFSILKKKHIVLLVLLKDKSLFHYSDIVPNNINSIYTKAAAVDLVLRRNKTIHNLKKLGIEILDLFPEEVTAKTLNKYLTLKNRS